MANPAIWITFSVLFVLAGLLNLARGLKHTDDRRPARLLLALSCAVWASAAYVFRFGNDRAGIGLAVVAAAVMVVSALVRLRYGPPAA